MSAIQVPEWVMDGASEEFLKFLIENNQQVKAAALRSLLDDQTIQWEKSHLEGDWCEPRLVKFIKIKDISDKMKELARGDSEDIIDDCTKCEYYMELFYLESGNSAGFRCTNICTCPYLNQRFKRKGKKRGDT